MAIIEKYIPEKELALEYNSAKIIANPYDYKLSERLFVYDPITISSRYHIYNKTNETEAYLCDQLGLNRDTIENPYLSMRSEIVIPDEKLGDLGHYIYGLETSGGAIGTFIKYNNLIINEEALINDLSYGTTIKDPTKDARLIKSLKNEGFLKALELLNILCTNKDSLIPNLMYLATEFNNYSLDDIENIVFANKRIADKKHIILDNFRFHDDETMLTSPMCLATAILPIYCVKSPVFNEVLKTYLFDTCSRIGNCLYTFGLLYSFIYGSEILYILDGIKDPILKSSLETLFAIGYEDSSFCSKYLYSVSPDGSININSDIRACFNNNNEIRFENIKNLVNRIVTLPDFASNVMSDTQYIIPVFFARAIQNAHNYAYQVARVKHATLLYTEAKKQGVLNPEDFKNNCGSTGICSSYADDDDGDSVIDNSSELLNLMTDSYSGDMKSDFDTDKEKEVVKKRKSMPPALNAMDALKKDLNDSKYDYDIDYVKHPITYKDSYNNISSNIKMITSDLTRQIKEIRTYNTGGKQNGLYTGKLDKKNLWKYKTDHKIFYNNNYKLKEMDLAFGCILDESGSMYGEKIKNGRIVMIMLHEVLTSLGINHSIIGHTSDNTYHCKIYKYFQFKEESHYSLDKPYGLCLADNRRGNCDSGALFYMQSVLKQVRNRDKIVIIFSDGEPTECTDLDLTEQVKNMERNGIHVIGVGINFDSIKEYYPDNANGKNLKEMVDIVVSILKRYVLEKKED